jgi:hypothetical protein
MVDQVVTKVGPWVKEGWTMTRTTLANLLAALRAVLEHRRDAAGTPPWTAARFREVERAEANRLRPTYRMTVQALHRRQGPRGK